MTDPNDRIAQFENMAQADPTNDMAHFSLGSAYLQAQRFADAASSLQRCIEINPDMSKAYQLAGEALIATDRSAEAVDLLNRGYEVAASKGDMLPRDGIAELLRGLGHEPPQLSADAEAEAAQVQASGSFVCGHTGQAGSKLDEPPMRGPLGEWICEHISAETWQTWIGQGTKVINELRLDFSREEDQNTYDVHMCDFLGIDKALYEELTGSAKTG